MGAYMNEALFFLFTAFSKMLLCWAGQVEEVLKGLYKGFVSLGIGSGVESLMRFEDACQG